MSPSWRLSPMVGPVAGAMLLAAVATATAVEEMERVEEAMVLVGMAMV